MPDNEKRIMQISDSLTKEEWYQSNQNKLISLQKQIPDQVKTLVNEYTLICEKINIKTMDALYAQAFIDGRNSVTP